MVTDSEIPNSDSWWYVAGPVGGRVQKLLLRSGSFARESTRLAVIAQDLGVEGIKVGDALDRFKRERRLGKRRAKVADWIFRILLFVTLAALAFFAGAVLCFIFRRTAIQISAGGVSPTSNIVIAKNGTRGGDVLKGSVQFDLLMENPSSIIYQVPFLPPRPQPLTSRGSLREEIARVDCALRPYATSDSDSFVPLGAAIVSLPLSTVAVPANARSFAVPFEAAFSLSAAEFNSSNSSSLNEYIQQCKEGYLLMEVVITKLAAYTFVSTQAWPPFRSPPLPVPCRIISRV